MTFVDDIDLLNDPKIPDKHFFLCLPRVVIG